MHRSVSLQLFLLVVWIFLRSLGVICYDCLVFSKGHENYFKDWCLMNLKPAFLILRSCLLNEMAILWKRCKPDNFKWHGFLKFGFSNVPGLHLDFIGCESFLELYSPDIFALCETNLDGSIGTGNFSVWGYLPLIWIWKDPVTNMHGLAVYLKEKIQGLYFAWSSSLKNFVDS